MVRWAVAWVEGGSGDDGTCRSEAGSASMGTSVDDRRTMAMLVSPLSEEDGGRAAEAGRADSGR